MNGLLTAKEAAQVLKINVLTIYKYLEEGKLKGHRIIGTRWRIKTEDLHEFIEEQKKGN